MSEIEGRNLGGITGENTGAQPRGIRLRLPATSANLGPGFDAVGVALSLALTIEAKVLQAAAGTIANGPELTIAATGRDAERCARTRNNLIFETYREVLQGAGRALLPLDLHIDNEIPLGVGCGSSAAARLGGVMLANHFGGLGWSLRECIEEATRREGHPDNVSACALGHVTVSVVADGRVTSVSCGERLGWKLLLALPTVSLPTEKARAMLPSEYSRSDAVANVQRTGLLVAAFALGRGDLLQMAMLDRMHQPYRMEACPLLARLLPLAGELGVLGVALSGAGPGVLLVIEADAEMAEIIARIRQVAGESELEIVESRIGAGTTQELI
ncbi:MAG: homoserine kinase [Acidobacteriaceae bacterium]